jgi:hypothetical protein
VIVARHVTAHLNAPGEQPTYESSQICWRCSSLDRYGRLRLGGTSAAPPLPELSAAELTGLKTKIASREPVFRA